MNAFLGMGLGFLLAIVVIVALKREVNMKTKEYDIICDINAPFVVDEGKQTGYGLLQLIKKEDDTLYGDNWILILQPANTEAKLRGVFPKFHPARNLVLYLTVPKSAFKIFDYGLRDHSVQMYKIVYPASDAKVRKLENEVKDMKKMLVQVQKRMLKMSLYIGNEEHRGFIKREIQEIASLIKGDKGSPPNEEDAEKKS